MGAALCPLPGGDSSCKQMKPGEAAGVCFHGCSVTMLSAGTSTAPAPHHAGSGAGVGQAGNAASVPPHPRHPKPNRRCDGTASRNVCQEETQRQSGRSAQPVSPRGEAQPSAWRLQPRPASAQAPGCRQRQGQTHRGAGSHQSSKEMKGKKRGSEPAAWQELRSLAAPRWSFLLCQTSLCQSPHWGVPPSSSIRRELQCCPRQRGWAHGWQGLRFHPVAVALRPPHQQKHNAKASPRLSMNWGSWAVLPLQSGSW